MSQDLTVTTKSEGEAKAVGSGARAPRVGLRKRASRVKTRVGAFTLNLTVKTRVIVALVAFTAIGMALSSIATNWVHHVEVNRHIDLGLARIVTEFESQVSGGVNISTQEPFASTSDLLSSALQWILPSEDGDAIAIVGGEAEWEAPFDSSFNLQSDPAFVRTINAMDPADGIQMRSGVLHANTPEEIRIRYVAIPTSVAGDPVSGWYIAAIDRDSELSVIDRGFKLDVGISILALAAIAIFSTLVVRRLLAPIRQAKENAAKISMRDLSGRVPVVGSDDLAELTETINQMLDRLEYAFTSQREFFDDVGHELRTPVTIIRGHLELVDVTDPADVELTREIALDELERIQRLIDDLLSLAAVERPDFGDHTPADIFELTESVAEKASALGERDWQLESRARVLVSLDQNRITQAWLQLANNAVKYSSPHSIINIGSDVESPTGPGSSMLRLWVSDQGVGIPAADQGRIFERFTRAETGRGEEGSGLGLAIVKAIVSAHGGDVSVESVVGKGSRFTMRIPLGNEATEGSKAIAEEQERTGSP